MPKTGRGVPLAAGAVAVATLGAAIAWWQMRSPTSAPPPIVGAAQPTPPADVVQTDETRAERIAREKRRCALHVSALTADGDLVYDDALRFAGARAEADGTGIRVPNVQLGNGQWINALVTPEGCVLIRSLAAGPAPQATQ